MGHHVPQGAHPFFQFVITNNECVTGIQAAGLFHLAFKTAPLVVYCNLKSFDSKGVCHFKRWFPGRFPQCGHKEIN